MYAFITKFVDTSSFLITEFPSSIWQFAVVSWDKVGCELGDDFMIDWSSTTMTGDENLLSSKLPLIGWRYFVSSSKYFVAPFTLRSRERDGKSNEIKNDSLNHAI